MNLKHLYLWANMITASQCEYLVRPLTLSNVALQTLSLGSNSVGDEVG